MSIKDTRACIDAILDGSIDNCEFETDPCSASRCVSVYGMCL